MVGSLLLAVGAPFAADRAEPGVDKVRVRASVAAPLRERQVLVLVGVVLASCGSSKSSNNATATTDSSAASSAASCT